MAKMKKRYLYEVNLVDGDWERLTDTETGKVVEGHRLTVDDVFFLLGMGEQLDIEEMPDPDDVFIEGI